SQGIHATGVRAREIDLVISKVGEDFAATLGAGDEHVEAPLSPIAVEGSEVHGHLSVLVAPIAHTDEDDVPLVTLYTFQVLHKERLKRMRGEETFQFGLLAASLFDLVANGLGLRDAERGDAKREVRALARVLHHGVSDCACLD